MDPGKDLTGLHVVPTVFTHFMSVQTQPKQHACNCVEKTDKNQVYSSAESGRNNVFLLTELGDPKGERYRNQSFGRDQNEGPRRKLYEEPPEILERLAPSFIECLWVELDFIQSNNNVA